VAATARGSLFISVSKIFGAVLGKESRFLVSFVRTRKYTEWKNATFLISKAVIQDQDVGGWKISK
jgi:hypothetical protein